MVSMWNQYGFNVQPILNQYGKNMKSICNQFETNVEPIWNQVEPIWNRCATKMEAIQINQRGTNFESMYN